MELENYFHCFIYNHVYIFFIFRKNHTKTFAVDVTKKKKKKNTQIFERAIVQLATSNLDFDISFNQIQ